MYKNGKLSEVFDDTLNQTATSLVTRDRNLGINSNQYYFGHVLDLTTSLGLASTIVAGVEPHLLQRVPVDDNAWSLRTISTTLWITGTLAS
jgi:hypothetical protein